MASRRSENAWRRLSNLGLLGKPDPQARVKQMALPEKSALMAGFHAVSRAYALHSLRYLASIGELLAGTPGDSRAVEQERFLAQLIGVMVGEFEPNRRDYRMFHYNMFERLGGLVTEGHVPDPAIRLVEWIRETFGCEDFARGLGLIFVTESLAPNMVQGIEAALGCNQAADRSWIDLHQVVEPEHATLLATLVDSCEVLDIEEPPLLEAIECSGKLYDALWKGTVVG